MFSVELTLLYYANIFHWFSTSKILIQHLHLYHDVRAEIKQLEFDDLHEFLMWKNTEEEQSGSSFVQQCTPQTTEGSNVGVIIAIGLVYAKQKDQGSDS